MFPKNNLYTIYKKNVKEEQYSSKITDITKKITLNVMNTAINCCEDWNNALDIGAGDGHYSIPLLHKFKNVTIVEPDTNKRLGKLKEEYDNLFLIKDVIENTKIENKVDFILLADLFEHIPDINKFISYLKELQENGGIIYILTPNPLFCGPAIKSAIHHSKVGHSGHIRHYFEHEVEEIMKKNNYRLILKKYEETDTRKFIKKVMRAISRRDKKLSNLFLYKIFLGPILRFIISPIIKFLEYYTYHIEHKFSQDKEKTRAISYIFKKDEDHE